jgi:Helix-turn-helix domain
LVVNFLQFVGAGRQTPADAMLANTFAAMAPRTPTNRPRTPDPPGHLNGRPPSAHLDTKSDTSTERMTGTASALATYHRPAEVAAMLRCSEWWIKEQARKRRIPYARIGGSYRFARRTAHSGLTGEDSAVGQ